MDIDRHAGMDHEQRTEDVRVFLTGELRGLIDDLKGQLQFDMSAGMTTALIAAYRELGRLYQAHDRPGGKGLSEVAVARMLEQARLEARNEVLAELVAGKQKALESATSTVRESLIALSDKSLG